MIQSFFNKPNTINCRGKLIDISQPIVMGIMNITPDSFYSNSRFNAGDDILLQAKKILDDGATIIDIGAYSSRPGADHISEQEEWKRLSNALSVIRKQFPDTVISVDTFRASIAQKAVKEFDVDIINDISAGEVDRKMFETIAELKVPYIIMHMKGTPQNMQQNPEYENIVTEIFLYFAKKVEKLNYLGVNDIIIDPGFGFGKTIEHNYELMRKQDDFKIFELPVLVGISRKSMIYNLLNTTPENALNGTTALNIMALNAGANILRVHDVKEAVDVVKIFNKVNQK